MLRPLGNRVFARLFAAQVVALIGTGLLTVALGLLAYDMAGSRAGVVLGTALAIKMAAYVGVAPVVAALTHRIPRRALMIGSDAVRASIALLLPFVDQVWHVYVLIFVLQAASATFTPVFQSVIPLVLVDEEDYTRGLSLSRMAYDLESLVSPVVAAALLTVMTYDHLFVGTAAGFVGSAILVLSSRLPVISADSSGETLWQRTTFGSRIMLGQPVLRSLLALNVTVAAATALVVVDTVVLVRDVLGSDTDAAVAVLLACYGAGSMVVALGVPRLLVVVTDRRVMLAGAVVVVAGLLCSAATLFAAPPAPTAWILLAALWTALGAGTSLINTPSARLVRAHSDPAARTSVFAAQFSLSHACFFVTYPVAGWLGADLGHGAAAMVLAVVALTGLVVAARTWPTTSSLESPTCTTAPPVSRGIRRSRRSARGPAWSRTSRRHRNRRQRVRARRH